MAIKNQRVNGGEIAHLVKQRRRVVLQVKVGVPYGYPVQGHSVAPRMHEPEGDIVTTHEHWQRVVAGDVDRKRGVPPSRIRKAAFFGITQHQRTFAQIVFLAKGPQWIQRAPEIPAAGFELHPLTLFADHRTMHAQLRVAGIGKQGHRAHE